MARHNVPGVSLAVFGAGGNPVTRCYGEVRAGSGIPVDKRTLFEAASLTKPVFATIVAGLAEQGRLDLDRPLAVYLPAEASRIYDLSGITPRMVLAHSTGLPNWVRDDERPQPSTVPGAGFTYSGLGYMFLQVIVERLTLYPLQQLFNRTLAAALGLGWSRLEWAQEPDPEPESERERGHFRLLPGSLTARLDARGLPVPAITDQPRLDLTSAACATGHDASGQPQPKRNWPAANAAASLHTTPAEYARFMQLFLQPRDVAGVVSAAGLRAMLEPVTAAGDRTQWGMGWGLADTDAGRMLWHWGDNGPFKALCAAVPDRGAGLVVMTNGHQGLEVCYDAVTTCFPHAHPAIDWLRGRYQ